MNNRGAAAVIAAIAVGLAVTACSSNTTTRPAAGPSSVAPTVSTRTSPPVSKPLTRSQLVDRLLTVGDLAPGWVKQSRAVAVVAGVTPLCGEPLPAGDAVTPPVSAGFDSARSGVSIGESLSSFTTDDAAQTVVASAQHAATACDSYKSGGIRLSIAPLSLPTIGDYSFAVRLRYGNVGIDVVFAQVGSTVMQLALGPTAAIGPKALRQLANRARQRIGGR